MPDALHEEVLLDDTNLKNWAKHTANRAWVIGGHPQATRTDPLRVLLRAGCGFLIWFPASPDDGHRLRITAAASAIPVNARRTGIPDELPDLDQHPAIIWDDPRGRGEFALPPLIPAQHVQVRQM